MYENLKDFGKNVGEDGKIFSSRAKGTSKNIKEDGRRDNDADYTKKETYYKGSDVTSKVKTTTYFGYRYHLLADVDYELPIEYSVTKASKSEKEELKNISIS